MRAIVNTEYGSPDVLHLSEVERPAPKDNEILVKVRATAVSSGDVRIRKADPFPVRLFFGLLKPKRHILGFVFAGDVEAVGKNVRRFKLGDQVFGTTGMSFGAYAEYVCVPENGVIAIQPLNLTYEEAAAVPFGGNTALYFLRKGNIRAGQKVLIYGASGAVGTAAVQIAAAFGAEVTGVCGTANLELVSSLGASRVIDRTKEDHWTGDESYEIIYDTVGKSSFTECLKALKKDGCLVSSAAGMSAIIRGIWTTLTTTRKVVTGVVKETPEDIIYLKELIEAGKFQPVIDRTYAFDQIPDAHRYVETGYKKGNVVIKVAGGVEL